MNIGINPGHFIKAAVGEEERSWREALDLVVEAGFKHFDFVCREENVEPVSEYLKEKEITVTQSHIPFNRYAKKDYSLFREDVMACADRAKRLGSKILVVHGDEFDMKSAAYTNKRALEFNYSFFYPLVEYAEANGMRVAFENLFQDPNMFRETRFCAHVDELCELVDKYNSKNVGICWDSGHGYMQYGAKHLEALKEAGSRIICTHLHDNYYSRDLHVFPFLGEIDWKEFIHALRGTGYEGNFTYELVYDRLPKALAPEYLKLLYKTAEYIISL